MLLSQKALVVLSGGQDSATVAALALSKGYTSVDAITFVYGQKHHLEVEQAKRVAETLSVTVGTVTRSINKHFIVDLTNLFPQEDPSGLLHHDLDLSKPHPDSVAMPVSFVRGRNMAFFTVAFNYAMAYGHSDVYTGICETDYSGYTDCREEFRKSIQRAQQVGYPNSKVNLIAPLMYLDKAQTWELADNLGVLDVVRDSTLTCYNGSVQTNDWGMGCGECAACTLRANGYEDFLKGKT